MVQGIDQIQNFVLAPPFDQDGLPVEIEGQLPLPEELNPAQEGQQPPPPAQEGIAHHKKDDLLTRLYKTYIQITGRIGSASIAMATQDFVRKSILYPLLSPSCVHTMSLSLDSCSISGTALMLANYLENHFKNTTILENLSHFSRTSISFPAISLVPFKTTLFLEVVENALTACFAKKSKILKHTMTLGSIGLIAILSYLNLHNLEQKCPVNVTSPNDEYSSTLMPLMPYVLNFGAFAIYRLTFSAITNTGKMIGNIARKIFPPD